MRSIKLSAVLAVRRPEYVCLRLKPSNSIRNNNTHKLARSIAALHLGMLHQIKQEETRVARVLGRQFLVPTKVSIDLPSKVAFMIVLEKQKVDFFLIAPRAHLGLVKEKLGDVWPGVAVEEAGVPPEIGQNATELQLVYTKEDALSLAVDRRSNDLLASTLNIVEAMEPGDRAAILYNFLPCSQFGWRASYRHTIEKVRNGAPVDRDKTGTLYLFKVGLRLLSGLVGTVTEVLSPPKADARPAGGPLESLLDRLNGGKRVSEATMRKAGAVVINTQIVVVSESADAARQHSIARGLAQSFDTISEDNALQARPLRGPLLLTQRSLRGAAVNQIGDEECSNFLALPGRDLLERFGFIDKVETRETEVPEELRSGIMCIGVNRYRGHEQPAYISDDREYRNLTLVLIGPTRAGKSTLIGNLSRDAIAAGECVVIFDYISNCQLSGDVSALFPPERRLTIDCADPATMQGLGYNEVGVSADTFTQYVNAKKQSTQLLTLVNAVNNGDTPLSAKMERYLTSAALVVFVGGGSIRDVFGVLQDHRARREWLRQVPATQRENLAEYTASLEELDDTDKRGAVVSTKESLITGIIDRLNRLKANTYMEAMLKRSAAGNIDLVTELQKPQLITVRMPEAMFATDGERDVYATYWMTKLWLALQIREQRAGGDRTQLRKVNLVIDELYQVENTQRLLSSILSRLAKFGCKPIISAHYLNQIKHIRDELRSANASYMLISGCDKRNFEELKSELAPFEEEDLLRLPRYSSLNLIKSKDGYARFITKLPLPITQYIR